MNIVLDSNILVSAFLSPKGESARILDAAKSHTLILSSFIIEEIARVLTYDRIRRKFKFTKKDIENFLETLLEAGVVIDPTETVAICSGPDDNNILACAVDSDADYLVTRNIRHFPERYQGVTIILPNEFLKLLRGTKG